MSKHELFEKVYMMLDKITPLKIDCGKLCNRACCNSADEDAGMYLYPGEESMYIDKPDWLRVQQSAFTYGNGKTVLVAICKGECDRKLRPLSCRIFPLIPYIGHEGILKTKIDPRAVPVCPLTRPYNTERMNKEFIHAVNDVFEMLIKDEEIYSFICSLSKLIDEHENLLYLFNAGHNKLHVNKNKKSRRGAVRRRHDHIFR
ncbi:MAG TPA: hypothetical protein GX505_11865 [Clostridiales bacterium]|nr:hypothetical protein [Clostridiales bacterium]